MMFIYFSHFALSCALITVFLITDRGYFCFNVALSLCRSRNYNLSFYRKMALVYRRDRASRNSTIFYKLMVQSMWWSGPVTIRRCGGWPEIAAAMTFSKGRRGCSLLSPEIQLIDLDRSRLKQPAVAKITNGNLINFQGRLCVFG